MKSLIAGLLLSLCAHAAEAQVHVGDSCYTLTWSMASLSLYDNPDSILVDTCASDSIHTVFWIRRGYDIQFVSIKAIDLPWAAHDTDLEVSWRMIDTAYPTIRAAFDSIERRFGSFTLKKMAPDDTSLLGGQDFNLIFNNYVRFDSIQPVMTSIEGVSAQFHWPVMQLGAEKFFKKTLEDYFYPSPAYNTLFVYLQHPGEIKILNAFGVIVQQSSEISGQLDNTIDLSHLASGEYFVEIRNKRIPFIHIR